MRLKTFETYFFRKSFLSFLLIFFFKSVYLCNNNCIILKKKLNLKTENFIFNGNERLNIFNINYSYFSRINTIKGNGGIIYSDKEGIDLKLNNCIFYYCSCTSSGGVIYFSYGNNIE